MFVVFDSNIWISEWGLTSSRGAATRFYIKQKGAKVALPEVIKLETEHKLKNEIKSYIDTIKQNYRQILAIFGQLKEIVLPDNKSIEIKTASMFTNTKLEIYEIPFSLESAKNSFLKMIDKLSPSNKNDQFRDGVIWADCLKLLEDDDVFLVTGDKAFYKDNTYEKGLADNLLSEANKCNYKLIIFPSITELLGEIIIKVEIDNNSLTDKFVRDNQESIDGILSKNGFKIGDSPVVEKATYATEDPNRLYIEFKITYNCEDISGRNRSNAKMILEGDGSYYVIEKEFSEIRNYGEELLFRLEDGGGESKNIRNRVIYAGTLVIGHKTIEHSVRYKLE